MKGFPNQIADLQKLAKGLRVIEQLLSEDKNPKDDGVFGCALVEAGVLGTGHRPVPVAQYLREQAAKSQDRQSFRTSARGLRELFRLLKLTDDSADELIVKADGRTAASYADSGLGPEQIAFWRRVISGLYHFGSDNTGSHPYQVLLRLVARRPGITRALCALALEARDDSADELDRIVGLSDLPEMRFEFRLRSVGPIGTMRRRCSQDLLNNWEMSSRQVTHSGSPTRQAAALPLQQVHRPEGSQLPVGLGHLVR